MTFFLNGSTIAVPNLGGATASFAAPSYAPVQGTDATLQLLDVNGTCLRDVTIVNRLWCRILTCLYDFHSRISLGW